MRDGYPQGIIRIPQNAGEAGAGFVSPFETDLVSSSLDMRWEASFWGPNAQRVTAAKADLAEQLALQESIRLMVSAEVARNWFEIRGLDQQLRVVRRNREAQAGVLELTRQRARAGLAAELDVERQQALLAAVNAAIPPLEYQRDLRWNRLAVLAGGRDRLLADLSFSTTAWKLPALGEGIPSELLLRRPDVRAAGARVQAAAARLRQARADRFPRLLLTGLLGRQATNLSGLTLGAGNFFAFGPQLQLPVFNGGRIRAQIDASSARLSQAELAYEQDLRAAFQEAEDALAGYRSGLVQIQYVEAARDHNRTAVELSVSAYQAGVADFLGVLDAEQKLLEADLRLAETHASAAVQSVLLFRALAGGWPQ